jgi:hypothetical protein
MKNLRDWLKDISKREVVKKSIPLPTERRQVIKQAHLISLHNMAADRRKELVSKPRNESYKAMHYGMSENDAASQALFYEFLIKHRDKGWDTSLTRLKFERWVIELAANTFKEQRHIKKHKERIEYKNMEKQQFAPVRRVL